MATDILRNMANEGEHAVGSISSIQVKTLANGAKVEADIDNWNLVELSGFNEDGERTCKALTAGDKVAYLLATPEQRFLGEDIAQFFNGEGEFARLVLLEPGYTRFEVSNFEFNSGVTEVDNGLVAHYDTETQKFILSDAASAHTDYATSKYKFEVVGDLMDTAGNFLQETVRLMVIEG